MTSDRLPTYGLCTCLIIPEHWAIFIANIEIFAITITIDTGTNIAFKTNERERGK